MPFVPQAVLDALRQGATDAAAAAERAEARYEALLERYHALKMRGGTAEAPVSEPDVIDLALGLSSRGMPQAAELRRRQAAWAAEQKAAGRTEADIAKELIEGQDGAVVLGGASEGTA